jgi:hypothetical protein
MRSMPSLKNCLSANQFAACEKLYVDVDGMSQSSDEQQK